MLRKGLRRLVVKMLLLVLFLINGSYATSLPPKFFPMKVVIRIDGKNRVYFRLDKQDPLVYEIEGPKYIRVISRIDGVENGSNRYRFLYHIDDNEDRLLFSEKGYPSDGVYLVNSGELVSRSNSLYIQVPEGKHSYRFYDSYKNDSHVYIRVTEVGKSTGSSGKPSSALNPVKAEPEKYITVQNKRIKYYTLTYDNPVYVLPPPESRLLIFSRLQFDYWMEEPAQYRLQLKRGKSILRTWLLTTEKSNLSLIEDTPDIVPGQYRKVSWSVGAETDTLTLRLLDRDKTVLVKFRTIP